MLSAARATASSMRHVVRPMTVKAMTATVPSAIATGPLKLGHAAPPPIPNVVWRVPVRAMGTDSKKTNLLRPVLKGVDPADIKVITPGMASPETCPEMPIIQVRGEEPIIVLGYSGQGRAFSDEVIAKGKLEDRLYICDYKFYSRECYSETLAGGSGALFTLGIKVSDFVETINRLHGTSHTVEDILTNPMILKEIIRGKKHTGIDTRLSEEMRAVSVYKPFHAEICKKAIFLEHAEGADKKVETHLDRIIWNNNRAYLGREPEKSPFERFQIAREKGDVLEIVKAAFRLVF